MSRHPPEDAGLSLFYAHLVVATAVQLAVLVAALARHAIRGSAAGVLLVVGLAPRLRRNR